MSERVLTMTQANEILDAIRTAVLTAGTEGEARKGKTVDEWREAHAEHMRAFDHVCRLVLRLTDV